MIENALLANVLQALATDDGVAEDHPEIVALANDPASVSALTTTLDKMGGHILWTDFWVAVSRLMTGASLDSVRCDTTVPRAAPYHAPPCHVPPCHRTTSPGRSTSSANPSMVNPAHFLQPLPRLRQVMMGEAGTLNMDDANAMGAQGTAGTGTGTGGNRPRSDSDIARELQAEFDGGGADNAMLTTGTSSASTGVAATSAGAAPAAPAVDPAHLSSMMDMGLEESWCRLALRRCNNDPQAAISFCFENDMAVRPRPHQHSRHRHRPRPILTLRPRPRPRSSCRWSRRSPRRRRPPRPSRT